MVRRVILGLIFVGVLTLVYVGYKNWSFRRAMLSGEVTSGSGETTAPEGAAVPPATEKASNQQKLASPPQTNQAPSKQAGPPNSDTICPNPPNGAVFAGTGHFQVYRQGNLTWRINTDTGKTCILFATTEEWRKPRVYQNGCGNSAKQ